MMQFNSPPWSWVIAFSHNRILPITLSCSFLSNHGTNEQRQRNRLFWKPTWLSEKIFLKQLQSPSHHHRSKDWEHRQVSLCNCRIGQVILRSTLINRPKILLLPHVSGRRSETSFRFIGPMCRRKKLLSIMTKLKN